MRKPIILFCAAASLGACGQSTNEAAANESAATAAAEAPKPAYCFFKDSETKDWKGKVDKDGNVVITGKAYREDSRYKAILSPATISGTAADIAPTITVNDTGYASPDNWWPITATVPNSQSVETVNVKCGDKTLKTIKLARKK
jgi:hypothetical protein